MVSGLAFEGGNIELIASHPLNAKNAPAMIGTKNLLRILCPYSLQLCGYNDIMQPAGENETFFVYDPSQENWMGQEAVHPYFIVGRCITPLSGQICVKMGSSYGP